MTASAAAAAALLIARKSPTLAAFRAAATAASMHRALTVSDTFLGFSAACCISGFVIIRLGQALFCARCSRLAASLSTRTCCSRSRVTAAITFPSTLETANGTAPVTISIL